MVLGFSKQLKFKGGRIWATRFKEKVLTCLSILYQQESGNYFTRKLHSIREDKKDRWKLGMKIHFVYGNRTKHRECWFLWHVFGIEYISIVHPPCCGMEIYVHDKPAPGDSDEITKLNSQDIERLALNDGFDSLEDFKEYFKDDFHGKLIHWTELKYGQKVS